MTLTGEQRYAVKAAGIHLAGAPPTLNSRVPGVVLTAQLALMVPLLESDTYEVFEVKKLLQQVIIHCRETNKLDVAEEVAEAFSAILNCELHQENAA